MRTLTALAAVTLTASMLTGCGSGSSAYCKDLKSDKAYFQGLSGSSPDVAKLDEAFSRLHDLAAEAPDDIADDWKVLDNAITTITKAMKEAGVNFKDLAKMQSGQLPKGVDMAKLQALGPKLQALAGAKFDKATKNIEKHAKDECGVTLGSS